MAPKGAEQSDLTLKGVHEILNDPAKLKDLEQRDGITRSQLEQFVRKFEKVKAAPAGPGREIKIKPGEQTPAKPSADLPGLDPSVKFNSKTRTDSGSMPQDQLSNNFEGMRFQLPPELKEKYQQYTKSIANVAVGKSPAAAPSSKKGK